MRKIAHGAFCCIWLSCARDRCGAGEPPLTASNSLPEANSLPGTLTVATDGTAQFKTVQAAINAAATGTPMNPPAIWIKPGTYRELIYIQREKRFLHLIGDNPTNTILTYDLNARMPDHDGKPIGTFRTASTLIDADDLVAENITFENSAGPVGQALAIRIDGERITFRNCRFLGWQDTVLANRGRHYFENCYIAGHVDFIFGGATCWFENCRVHSLRDGYLTAASTPANQPFGFVFSNCKITAEGSELKSYLGRPWRGYASVTYLNTEMAAAIRPQGWDNWRDPAREKTVRFSEYRSSGPGFDSAARVKWARQLTEAEAKEFTLDKVLGGQDHWDPKESVR